MQYYDKKAVGERIKAIRLRNGMTQSRLAENWTIPVNVSCRGLRAGKLPALWIS